MIPSVYLDSSIPSYHLPQGNDPIIHARHLLTRRWWESELPRFDAYVSEIVLEEIGRGDPRRAAERLALVQTLKVLEVDSEVERVAQFYMEHFAMPRKNERDALHLAVASVHQMDYLLTW